MRKSILILVIAVLPLIIWMKEIRVPAEVLAKFLFRNVEYDLFNWWKSAVLFSVSLVLLPWLFSEDQKNLGFFRFAIYVYFALVVASCVLTNYPEVVLYGLPNYLEGALAIGCYCVLFLTAAAVVIELRSLEIAFSILAVVMFIFSAIQFFNGDLFLKFIHWAILRRDPRSLGMETWPLFGLMYNSNFLGTLAALIFPFFLVRKNWVMTFISVLLAVGSQSRGAWLAMILTTTYVLYQTRKAWALVPILFFAIGFGITHFNRNGSPIKFSASSSGRIYMWEVTLGMISPFDIFGYGPATYALEFPQDDAKGKMANGWSPSISVDRPHNFYLQVLHGSGILSLIAILSLFTAFFIQSKELCLKAAVLSYLIDVFFTDSCTSVAPLFWIALGTGVGFICQKKVSDSMEKATGEIKWA